MPDVIPAPELRPDLILDQIAEAVIYADTRGFIRLWNRGAEALFGFNAAEALGQSLDLIIPENLRQAHWRGFDAAIRSGKTRLAGHPTLTRAQHKSGEKRYVEMSFALVIDSGLVAGSVAVARDVTERVEREKAARQAGTAPLP
ncbi:PAS domain S-box protein [Aromatoleum aromaticum]|uniref:PAS domain S-box protein n=1 Tax=Aromatoleum aromaticum TaxID=551760 RepID=UPI001459EBCA|nr:PAS domain S-box protein [Aromatoleum aromaticum]NMG54798.1 PAS domain S-box protein [Aromatoleum aromaticum]